MYCFCSLELTRYVFAAYLHFLASSELVNSPRNGLAQNAAVDMATSNRSSKGKACLLCCLLHTTACVGLSSKMQKYANSTAVHSGCDGYSFPRGGGADVSTMKERPAWDGRVGGLLECGCRTEDLLVQVCALCVESC